MAPSSSTLLPKAPRTVESATNEGALLLKSPKAYGCASTQHARACLAQGFRGGQPLIPLGAYRRQEAKDALQGRRPCNPESYGSLY